MAHRAAALSRGPQGPAHSSVGDEGLGFRLAWTAVAVGERHGVGREPVLAGAVPELQDDVPVPRGKLRTGRGRVVALYVRRVSVIHPRYSAHAGGIAPRERGLPQSRDTGERMTSLLQQSRAPLHLLLVTDGRTIPNWLYKCLDAVEGSKVATVVLALLAARKEGRNLRHLLFSLYVRIDRYLFRSDADAFVPIGLHSALPSCRVVDLQHALAGSQPVDPALVRALAAEHIDVVLDPFCLLPDAGLADLSTYGVWSVPFGQSGDPRTQSTPAFWEVSEGRPSTETRLCVQRKGYSGKRLLYSAVAPTDRRSVSRSKSRLYWRISAALARALLRLGEDPAAFVQRLAASAPVDVVNGPSGAPAGAPGNVEMLRAGTRLVRRYASDQWTRTLYREQWALAYRRGSSDRPGAGPFHTMVPPVDRCWA